ncbi:MAG: hypothetical protein WCE90_09690 [Candidatus Zixiibacteriota bacterium]
MVPLLLFSTEVEPIDLSATGGWGETIDQSHLISGAGSNLADAYESLTNATTISVSGCTGDTDNWRVEVSRIDQGGWYENLTIYVRRTSDGTGSGWVADGLSYIEVNSTGSQFFTGAGDRTNISIQYRLAGMSVMVPPENYSTTISFAVVDIP